MCILFWIDDHRYSVWRIEEPVSADGSTIGYVRTIVPGDFAIPSEFTETPTF